MPGYEVLGSPGGDSCFEVWRSGEWLGDIEELSDGTWIGDITRGNGPPSKPFTTQEEAIRYVVSSGRSVEPVGRYDPSVDYFQKCVDAGIPITKTERGFRLG